MTLEIEKYLQVTMPDGSKWRVPVKIIAEDAAEYYAETDEYNGDLKAARKMVQELFDSDDYEIEDWAANNMNWKDVKSYAACVVTPPEVDFQEGWVNGDKEII